MANCSYSVSSLVIGSGRSVQAWGEDETRETVQIILVPTDGGTPGQPVHGRKGRQQSLNFIRVSITIFYYIALI